MKKYFSRFIDKEIERYLNVMGAILIMGPKGCGKTTTAIRYANSILKLEPNKIDEYLQIIEFNPSQLMDGDKPKLIDEWQIIPVIWDMVRSSVDELRSRGNYILTTSTVVDNSKIVHSGAGRIHRLIMMPMSLYESNESNGKISIKELFENPEKNINGIMSDLTITDLIFASCRGGFSGWLNQYNKIDQLQCAKLYIKSHMS